MKSLIALIAMTFALPALAGSCPEGTVLDEKGDCVVVDSDSGK